MSGTEAEARIKINKMLEEAGWRLTDVINVLEGTRASFNIRNNKYEIIGE